MDETRLFAFEDDFVATLRCIPMAVRFKLDRCGVKISLRQWSQFGLEDRRALLMQPCDAPGEVQRYRDDLVQLLASRCQDVAKPLPEGSTVPWERAESTPAAVTAFANSIEISPPSDAQWRRLTPLERFVLLKLSRDNHDNVNFQPAMAELGLCPSSSLLGQSAPRPAA